MSRRPYVTATRLAEMRWSLGAEEWAVLQDVRTMRLAQATDLQALQALRGELQVRRFRRLLKRLSDEMLVTRLERTVGGKGAGSAGFIYRLGPAGQRLLASNGQAARVRKPWTPRPAWIQHALAISRLYVMLRQAEANGQLAVVQFEIEPASWRSHMASHGGQISLKPDAFVQLRLGAYLDSYFIEVDCGTESRSTLQQKFEAYRRYWESGQEQVKHGVFPRVLWLAPSDGRAGVLADVARRQPTDALALHQVAHYDRALDAFIEEPP